MNYLFRFAFNHAADDFGKDAFDKWSLTKLAEDECRRKVLGIRRVRWSILGNAGG